MKKLLLLSILLTSIQIKAQQNTFSKVYYDDQQLGTEEHSITRAFDNGYLIVGKANYSNGYVLRLDSTGEYLWNKRFIGNSTVDFNCITRTNDSCYLIGGTFYNTTISTNEALFFKIDSDGDTLWMKTISIPGYFLSVLAITQTNDSGFVMTGSASANVAPYTRIFAAKINQTGFLEWSGLYTGGNYGNTGNSIKQAPDSTYYLTGYIETNPPYQQDMFLMNLSQSGSVLWTKKYSPAPQQNTSGYDFEFINNSIVCLFVEIGTDAIMKTGFDGNVLWSKSYNYNFGGGPFYLSIPKIHLTSDSGFVFVSGGCQFDGAITKTDSVGNVEWSDNLFLIPIDVIETRTKEFFISGNGPLCGIRPQQVLFPQIGIIQTDSVGSNQNCMNSINITPPVLSMNGISIVMTSLNSGTENMIQTTIDSLHLISYSGCVDVSGGVNENTFNNDIRIYPNPSTGILTVTASKSKQAVIVITNLLGEEIYKTPMNNEKATIDISSSKKGIYFCKILSADQNTGTGKIVVY